MIYTEEEAKKKLCWEHRQCRMLSQISLMLTASHAKDDKEKVEIIKSLESDDDSCIASDCMKWKWDRPFEGHIKKGYCGLVNY